MTLNQANSGKSVTVKKINCKHGELSRLQALGISEAVSVVVLKNCKKLGCVVRCECETVGLSLGICREITVE